MSFLGKTTCTVAFLVVDRSRLVLAASHGAVRSDFARFTARSAAPVVLFDLWSDLCFALVPWSGVVLRLFVLGSVQLFFSVISRDLVNPFTDRRFEHNLLAIQCQ